MAAPPARTGPALPGPGHAPHPPLSRQAPLAAQTVSRQPPQVIRVTSVATPPGGGRALTSEIPVIPASSELKTRSRAATVSSHTRWVRAAGLLSSGLLRPLQASHPRGSFLPRVSAEEAGAEEGAGAVGGRRNNFGRGRDQLDTRTAPVLGLFWEENVERVGGKLAIAG